MITNNNNAKKRSRNELSAQESQERDYIEYYLTNYVEANSNYENWLGLNSQWYKVLDFKTRVLKQVIEFIKREEFSLYELYYIFFCQDCRSLEPHGCLKRQKLESIDFIEIDTEEKFHSVPNFYPYLYANPFFCIL